MDSVHGLSKLELWLATAFVLDIEKREKDIISYRIGERDEERERKI